MPLTDYPVGNPEYARFMAAQLRQLRGPSPLPNISSAIDAASELITTYTNWRPATVDNLAWAVVGNDTKKYLFIDGLRNNTQSERLLDGYGTRFGVPVVYGNNVWLTDQWRVIRNTLGLQNLTNCVALDVIGYSAGGALAALVGEYFRDQQISPFVRVCSFGAPRTGQAHMRDAWNGAPIARWMTKADPIPLIPPRLQDAPWLAAVMQWGRLFNWSMFVHAPGGIAIGNDGTTTEAVIPPTAALSPVASLISWLTGVEDDPSNPHSLVSYTTALELVIQNQPGPRIAEVDQGPGEQPDTPRRRTVNQQRERVEAAIFDQAAAQTANPVVTPEATLFQPFRQGRVWYVSLGNMIVLTAGPEKRARHIARAGNDFLRSLQKQAVVDPEAILSQMTEFMNLAADPTSGFRPSIKTEMPS